VEIEEPVQGPPKEVATEDVKAFDDHPRHRGYYSALFLIKSETGTNRPLFKRREPFFGSYAGLVPSVRSSGSGKVYGPITKARVQGGLGGSWLR
jgi:hypothetical protein